MQDTDAICIGMLIALCVVVWAMRGVSRRPRDVSNTAHPQEPQGVCGVRGRP